MNSGTITYGLLAGMSFGIGALFLIAGRRRSGSRAYEVSAGCFAVASAGQTLATVQMHTSDTVEAYASVINGSFAIAGLASAVSFVWLLAATTRLGWPQIPVLITVAGVGLALIGFLTPGGLIVESVTGFREVSLFGESFVVHEPNRSSWRFLLDGFLLAVTVYFVAAIVANHRRARGRLTPILAGSAVAIGFGLYDSLVDEGVVSTPYLAPFGLIAFAAGLAVEHTRRLVETEQVLSDYSFNLEELVAARTESLHAANARVLDELAHQEATVGQLTRMTRQSITLGALEFESSVGIEERLGDVVSALTEIVAASSMKLDLDQAARPGLANVCIERRASNPRLANPGHEEEELQFPLRVQDRALGRLVVRIASNRPISGVQHQLAKLSAQLLTTTIHRFELESALLSSAVDQERRRIARDLHDSLSQRLYAAAFQADVLTSETDPDQPMISDQAQTIRDLVLSSLAEMRTLLFELQPEVFKATSLTSLVEQLSESMGQVYGRTIECAAEPGPTVPHDVKLALYRMVQESLSNALRHSEAEHVSVSIRLDAQGVGFEVSDDGVGFDTEEEATGQGLENLADRATQIGATLDVTSASGLGTTAAVTWLRDPPGEPQVDLDGDTRTMSTRSSS